MSVQSGIAERSFEQRLQVSVDDRVKRRRPDMWQQPHSLTDNYYSDANTTTTTNIVELRPFFHRQPRSGLINQTSPTSRAFFINNQGMHFQCHQFPLTSKQPLIKNVSFICSQKMPLMYVRRGWPTKPCLLLPPFYDHCTGQPASAGTLC